MIMPFRTPIWSIVGAPIHCPKMPGKIHLPFRTPIWSIVGAPIHCPKMPGKLLWTPIWSIVGAPIHCPKTPGRVMMSMIFVWVFVEMLFRVKQQAMRPSPGVTLGLIRFCRFTIHLKIIRKRDHASTYRSVSRRIRKAAGENICEVASAIFGFQGIEWFLNWLDRNIDFVTACT